MTDTMPPAQQLMTKIAAAVAEFKVTQEQGVEVLPENWALT